MEPTAPPPYQPQAPMPQAPMQQQYAPAPVQVQQPMVQTQQPVATSNVNLTLAAPAPQQTVNNTTVVMAQAQPQVFTSGCRACGGSLSSDFTCCGICCAIVFFPIGILCCLCWRKKRCSKCGIRYG